MGILAGHHYETKSSISVEHIEPQGSISRESAAVFLCVGNAGLIHTWE
jgi:hypothetical protein